MKNSSDKPPAAPHKRKGPIRTGAVVPTLVLAVLVGAYFVFFFDHTVRRGLEYAGTHILGAELDVGSVHTSFLHATLEVRNIQVTDKEHPERNLVQIGSIKFAMLGDALLRAKVVVDEASILNIQALVPRARAGRVLPPPPPSDGQPSALKKVEQEVAAQTAQQYNGNFLGDIAGLMGGGSADTKAQLTQLQSELKSDAKIKELQKDLAQKKVIWDQRIKALPQNKELQVYVDRIKALKFDLNNPGELAKNVGEAQKIVNEAQSKVKIIDQTQRDLKADLGNYSQQYKEIEKLVQEDARDLQKRLKLPNLDAKEFSQQIFMRLIEKKLGGLAKYVELSRHYMPAGAGLNARAGAASSEPVIPPKRGTGRTYRFPVTTGYPLFWLKHAAISSEANSNSNSNSVEYSGNLKGEIKDVSTDPAALGRPALLLLTGDFPKQNIQGLDARLALDHTTDTPKDSLDLKVARFPVAGQKLSTSPDVLLSLEQARGHSEMHATFINDEVQMQMKNDFNEIKYDLHAKNQAVQEIIDGVLRGLPSINVDADVRGSLAALDIHVHSNLGDELSKGFQKQLQAKIQQAKASLQKMIDATIGGDRQQLKAQLDQVTGGLTKNMDGEKAGADKAVKDAQNQANPIKGDQGKKLEEEGKKLLKQFHLGG